MRMLPLLLVLLLEVFRQGGTSTEEEAFRTEPVKRSRIHNCPNQCSSNGYCKSNCTCFPGFHGVDCSLRVCPSGRAWVDLPHNDNLAHANFTECSNMGKCNRLSGECECNFGYTGAACERLLCPIGTNSRNAIVPCSGHGICMSSRDRVELNVFSSNTNNNTYDEWDADMIYACNCDDGWQGSSCHLRTCPYGDDPITAGVSEVQVIDCETDNNVGSVIITYGRHSTPALAFNISTYVLEYELERLKGITDVTITTRSGVGLCSHAGSITEVTFLLPQKPLYKLAANKYSDYLGYIDIKSGGATSQIDNTVSSVVSTKEYVECSNRGTCDATTGRCACFAGYASSDGKGALGSRGDCGYHEDFAIYGIIPKCPLYNNMQCGGSMRGTCDNTTGTCTCLSAYSGSDCSMLSCPSNTAWFGTSITLDGNGERIGSATCAGIGDCVGTTGKCTNCGGNFATFIGDGCEKLSCLVTGYDSRSMPVHCNGNGACISLKDMAKFTLNAQGESRNLVYTSPWDADMVYGCACFRLESIDDQYAVGYEPPEDVTISIDGSVGTAYKFPDVNQLGSGKFYRGPFALSATNFVGVNCAEKECPKGDNPDTHGQDEIQSLRCYGDSGYFTLKFRDNVTTTIPATATSEELMVNLQDLYTIHKVEVSVNGNLGTKTPICSVGDVQHDVFIQFLSEYGDLPNLIPDVTLLTDTATGHVTYINVTEIRKGTKEDQECSGQGVCDHSTGVCTCSPYYESSDGSIFNAGSRGDCTYYNPPGGENLPYD